MSKKPAVLRLPSVLNAETLPVGPDGVWDWIAAVLKNRPGVIEFVAPQDIAQLRDTFGILHRACELAVGAGALTGPELALVAKRCAQDPLLTACERGRAFRCLSCQHLWKTDRRVEQRQCPACKNPINHAKSAEAAEVELGVDGPYTKATSGSGSWF